MAKKKKDRNEKAVEEIRSKNEGRKLSEARKREFAANKNNYIRNIINARYFICRCNMIAEQVQSGKILENIDGCPKPKEYMMSEYALTKMQAINSFREANFAKKTLMEKPYNLTEDDIEKVEDDYYNGKIVEEATKEEYQEPADKSAQYIKEK